MEKKDTIDNENSNKGLKKLMTILNLKFDNDLSISQKLNVLIFVVCYPLS